MDDSFSTAKYCSIILFTTKSKNDHSYLKKRWDLDFYKQTKNNSLFGPVGGDEILWFDDFSVARGLTLFGGHGFTSSASPATQGLVEELTSEGLS